MACSIYTNVGCLKVEIFCDLVPKAALSFLKLVGSGSYDNTKFHRNIAGFAIQCGKKVERIDNDVTEINSELTFNKKGVVAFASSTEFFITYAPQEHLNGTYTIIGQVVDGFLFLNALEREDVGKKNKPLRALIIKTIVINANPLADID